MQKSIVLALSDVWESVGMSDVVFIPYSERQRFIQFYKSNREKIKVQRSDLCFLLLDDDSKSPKAAVKFTQVADGCWLLRNMLVAKEARGEGYGHALLENLSDRMAQLASSNTGISITALYCFPWSELTGFYCQHGFRYVSPEALEHGAYSKEVVARYHAYTARGLGISFCCWGI